MVLANIKTVYDASYLHAMYQELLPLGIDPLQVYKMNFDFLDALSNDKTTFHLDFNFDPIINAPADCEGIGKIFVSVHLSEKFSNIPMAMMTQLYQSKELVLMMSRKSREKVPAWKEAVYAQAEQELGLKFIYAEDASTAIKIIKTLKRGGNVMTFVDALFGINESTKTAVVDFIHNKISVPVGVFEIAKRIGSQVVPVVSTELNSGYSLSFGDSLTVNTVTQKTVQKVFSFFARAIIANPGKWSQWGFMYDQSEQDYYLDIQSSHTNKPNIQKIEHNGHPFTFDYNLGVLDRL